MARAAHCRIVAARLVRGGRVRRRYLGVAGQNVPLLRRVVLFHELPRGIAVRAQSTAPDGTALAAGLTSGDIIVAADDVPVADIVELHRLMTEERVGKRYRSRCCACRKSSKIAVTPHETPPRPAA